MLNRANLLTLKGSFSAWILRIMEQFIEPFKNLFLINNGIMYMLFHQVLFIFTTFFGNATELLILNSFCLPSLFIFEFPLHSNFLNIWTIMMIIQKKLSENYFFMIFRMLCVIKMIWLFSLGNVHFSSSMTCKHFSRFKD